MENEKREYQEPPEMVPEPAPIITPDMVQTTFRTLETMGILHYYKGGVYIPTEKGWKLLMRVGYEKEEIIAHGHPDIIATHITEIEVTKSSNPNKNTAVIAVKANKVCKDFNSDFKRALQEGKKFEIVIDAEGIIDKVNAFGSPSLKLNSKEGFVITKSDNVNDKTIGIMSDKAAFELRRELIEKLKNPKTKVKITLEIKS